MKSLLRSALLSLALVLANAPALLSQADYAAPILAGLSNHGKTNSQPYVTAGTRAYLIGTQDGDFPDMGDHSPGEMAGAWLHPIKLVDGFWATVTDLAAQRHVALSASTDYITYPYGNRFRYGPALDSLEIDRFQFSPDGQQGLVIQYTFRNASARARQLAFQLSIKTDLRPVWFSDTLGITDARDTVAWEPTNGVFVAQDLGNPWFCVWGATSASGAQPVTDFPPIHTKGLGVAAASRHQLSVGPKGVATLTFVIAGSATAKREALAAYTYLAKHHASLLASKQAHYASVVNRARVRIPDQRWQEVYNWVKVNNQWLVRDVPGIGRGLGAGLMEYPWWFGTDASYSLQGVMETGDFELAKGTLRLLRDQSRKANGNGRIIHEVVTNGAVYNPGNTQETSQFITTVGRLIDWTGDLSFAREMYPAMKQGLDWLLNDMDQNRNLFPEGYGIMEVHGLNAELIDVAVYTQQALVATARVARALHEAETASLYEKTAAQLKARINERFWAEDEGSYADFYGTRAQAISVAEGAIKQLRMPGENKLTEQDIELIGFYERLKARFATMPDSSRGWITNKNWVISTPMEAGIAPRERAIQMLDKVRRENVGEYGPFLAANERRAMMTISTGVQAVAEANYGRMDQAVWYVGKIVETFNRTLPGSISEMMPDYGCFTQAWTNYGVAVPLIRHIFGIQPDAVNKTVILDPHLPTGWEDLGIEDLPVGSNTISFSRAKTARGIEYHIKAKEGGWRFVLKGAELPGATYYVNGAPASFTSAGLRLTGRTNQVLVVPPTN